MGCLAEWTVASKSLISAAAISFLQATSPLLACLRRDRRQHGLRRARAPIQLLWRRGWGQPNLLNGSRFIDTLAKADFLTLKTTGRAFPAF